VACMGNDIKTHRILIGKPRAMGPLLRNMSRWEDNIKMDMTWIELEGVHWIYLAQGRDQWRAFVRMLMNIWPPQNAGNFVSTSTTVSFSCVFYKIWTSQGGECCDSCCLECCRQPCNVSGKLSASIIREREISISNYTLSLRLLIVCL
jgi:hypothetical protein